MFLGVFLLFVVFFSWLFLWGIDPETKGWVLGYRNVSRIASCAYLILQLMALVDFSFTCHEMMTEKMDETNVNYNFFIYCRNVINTLIKPVAVRISGHPCISPCLLVCVFWLLLLVSHCILSSFVLFIAISCSEWVVIFVVRMLL